MAKSNRLITLDVEINEKLKKVDNASALVNDLLSSHFNAEKSSDVNFLAKKVEELDLQMQQIGSQRDGITKRIRLLSERSKEHKTIEDAKARLQNQERKLTNWLAQQVKNKIITFEEYRNIKLLDNWEDCVNAVIGEELDLQELVEKAKAKKVSEDLNSGSGSY